MARVVSVNISAQKGEQKQPVAVAQLKPGHGIMGDAHAGDWHRQVSLLGVESIAKVQAHTPKQTLLPGMFAENLTTEGITLYQLPVGTRLQMGEAVLEVTQIGKECHSGCEIRRLAGDCVMPREGVFATVIREGTVCPGDAISLVEGEAD